MERETRNKEDVSCDLVQTGNGRNGNTEEDEKKRRTRRDDDKEKE